MNSERRPVYLAGPIFGHSDQMALRWRQEATALLGSVLDPMRRDYRGHEAGNEAAIVRHDLTDIANSRAVLVMALAPSWGTAMELVYARIFGVPVVAVTPSPVNCSPWLVYHSVYRCTTLADAITYIEEYCR